MNKDRNDLPLVSICMSSYNNAKFVLRTLQSIQKQTYKNIQLVIVDDCSVDNSVELIDQWLASTDTKCCFVKHERNMGVCRVANQMIENSLGKYMSIIASDDIMMPEKIERQVAEFEQLTADYGLLYSDVYVIDENDNILNDIVLKSQLPEFVVSREEIFIELLKSNFIPGVTVLIRVDAMREVGGFDEELFYDDWDMWLRISKLYKVHYSSFISAKYRVLSTSMWHSRSVKFYEATIKLLSKHLGYSEIGDKIINDNINENAELIYKNGGALTAKWLKQRWQNQHSPTAAMLYIMAVLHLPYSAFERLRKLLGK